ncbi:hypothetical protein [Allobaculum sp. Allo2]|uniref:hypothetical protein n=1 Tax=Allobaculum sp. Allo2 TaxID=2853432 RepID=UPI001F621570|nr:hypothetical protein [Allobaculum sp. Allo2]UNT92365.1 hypothetical protein KWG61_09235 [Allobaculum sp. Allo2]
MKIHLQDAEVRSHLFEGGFGLEKESLRIESKTGKMAQSLHPFSHSKIVQDFAENQTEINTAVYPDWQSARRECEELTVLMQNILAKQGETLWPFSNPPMISSMEDIPMLQSGLSSSTEYRHYLADRYGKMKMLFSGIHYNFRFPTRCSNGNTRSTLSTIPVQDMKLTPTSLFATRFISIWRRKRSGTDGSLMPCSMRRRFLMVR